MQKHLPSNAQTIFVEWPIKEGGLLVAAYTDRRGQPYLAVKTLSRLGKSSGLYDWMLCRKLIADRVVGFIDGNPLVIRLQAFVTRRGLAVIISLPPRFARVYSFEQRYFACWGSGEPPMALTIVPGIDHLAVNSFPFIHNKETMTCRI